MAKNSKSRSLVNIAGIVAIATLISKVFGLVREQIIAAAFGVGPVVNAYVYAYILPGFLLILLGGLNGPFHSALVSVLAKDDNKKNAASLVETVTTVVSVMLLGVTVLLIVFAPLFIDVLGPGLTQEIRTIAVQQLRIMAPLALLAGLIGIGFGTLSASDQYWLPSISPLFSSVATIGAVGVMLWQLGESINAPQYIQLGGMVLAGSTLTGAILQWLAQLIAQGRAGMGKLRLRWEVGQQGVKEVFKVMMPATLSSGMLHINVYTDMYFASYIENAAAAMRYSNFIVLTPLGIISNTILVPLLPVLSKLTAPEQWPELKERIRQGLLLSAITMLPLTAIFVALATPIVKVIYQRYAFAEADAQAVAPVLMAYGLGMFFYLGRDVLVRVFYALGDGETPFRISIINIIVNGILDFVLVKAFATPGLVFATIGVNIVSMVAMLVILDRRLNGLPLLPWTISISGIALISALSGGVAWGVNRAIASVINTDNFGLLCLQLAIAIGTSLIVFAGLVTQLKLPEVDLLMVRVKAKILKR